MHVNKRASLEISIQAIVIVVLAMTLLGLGLGFIRGMFKNIGGLSEQVTEDVRNKIGRQLIESDEKVAFPRSQVSIKRGEAVILDVGIRNKGNADIEYKMHISKSIGPPGVDDAVLTETLTKWFQYDKLQRKLNAADFDVRQIKITIPTDATQGSYFYIFDVNVATAAGDQSYSQKDFFVVVTG